MDAIESLKLSLSGVLDRINKLVKAKPARSTTSDDTAALSGVSKATLLSDAKTRADTHINSKANPHKTTALAVGGANKTYADGLLTGTILMSSFSISQFGDTETADLGISFQGWLVKFSKPIPVFLQGNYRMFPAQDINLISLGPANKTFYMYLTVADGTIGWVTTTELLPESLSNMFVGKVVCGGTAINSLTGFTRFTRLGIYRISESAQGCAIPSTVGVPTSAQKLAAGWAP